jgi:predicted ATPase
MLTRLKAKNFKSWRDLDWKLAPITGLFGTNSSGKSSLLQLLLLLKQTKETTDRGLALDFGGLNRYVNLGTFRDAVHGHSEGDAISWELTWELPKVLEIEDPTGKRTAVLFSGRELTQKADVGILRGAPRTRRLQYDFDASHFILKPKEGSDTAFALQFESKKAGFKFIRAQGRKWDLPGPVKSYAFPDRAKTYFQNANFLSQFELAYEAVMDNLYYLGPLREYPKREYTWAGSRPTDVGLRGEKVVDAVLSATAQSEKRNLGFKTRRKHFQEIIAHWLQELNLIHDFQVEDIAKGSNLYKVTVRREENSPPALLTDVGFGVSQILPVLVLLYYVPDGAAVILEQPEIHLHPKVQAGLADLIVSVVKARNIQVVVESHSEHLLRRLQRRVAEELFPQANIALYFCDFANGESSLTRLKLDSYGRITNWPEGFFGDDFEEIAAIEKAGLVRRQAAE